MKFYMTPGSCSTGIHILLEELELLFEVYIVDLLRGDHRRPEFLAINPRGTIPTLVRDDGSALGDFRTIALWLAGAHPKRQLLPAQVHAREHVLRVVDQVVDVIHGQGFTRIFVADQYASDIAEQSAVQREGRSIVERAFARLAPVLQGVMYVAEPFSIADAALFYVEFWADRTALPLPTRLQAHYHTMLQRPAVRQVLAEEGYVSTLRTHAATRP
jgi:glutathione S-transferase